MSKTTSEILLAPGNSPLQNEYARKYAAAPAFAAPPAVCVVTGGTGFVGMRLVEMLVERGAKKVICFDIVPPPEGHWQHPAIEYRHGADGDITRPEAVAAAVQGADCVWHNAAAVGPFHPLDLYDQVNHIGTLNVIAACKQHNVTKIVMSSSPSTRFTGADIDGLTEDELPTLPMKEYLQEYAASKAAGEKKMCDASGEKCANGVDALLTVAVAPHQVYGPRDNLFMPNMLEAAGTGRLRIFSAARTGNGMNKVRSGNCSHVMSFRVAPPT
jgi:nucleoside-diphosphate-sugar epimerase